MEEFSQNGAIRAIAYRAMVALSVTASIFGLIAPGTQSLAKTPQLDGGQKDRVLTFEDRVAYQYAIEEVYWRHRIWPKENPGPKPSLDDVMSRAQVEKKVEDYLRNSQSLENYRQRPITPEQLQAETDRMAQNTRQPEVLRELFAALGNDPFVVAECLARQVLAERLVTSSAAHEQEGLKSWRARAENPRPRALAATTANYTLPTILDGVGCTDDTWTTTSTTNAPSGRALHTAVWTGSEMIVWGGNDGSYSNTGGRYSPSTDSWTATSTANAPAGRYKHTAVWTGSEMIVWGGYSYPPGNEWNTGGRYNPGTDSWTATNTTEAPVGRESHAAVWTGSQMIVWGGYNFLGDQDTGGKYDPSVDSWTATSITNAPTPRYADTAVWTGNEMIVWGGLYSGSGSNTGGRYNPGTDSWTATSITNVPSARAFHTAVWTGSEMIVWGGGDAHGNDFNTGGRYNPSTDSWSATSATNAPSARDRDTAVWSGSVMIVWGGQDYFGYSNTGGRYNPSTNSWTVTSTTNAPDRRGYHTTVWSGSEMIVWGGDNFSGALNTGGRYCAQSQSPMVQSASSRKAHAAAGNFDVDLPMTGVTGVECRSTGGTNDYTIIVTFAGNVTVNGSPQAELTTGTGCVGSGGTCTGNVSISGNIVTVPLTNIANAQTINTRVNGVNNAGADAPASDFDIPMSILVGDTNANRTVNAADVSQTNGRLGQTIDTTNFRSDVNANGSINAADTAIIKQNSGTSLPP